MSIKESPPNTFRTQLTLKRGTIWFLVVVLAIAPFFPLSSFAGHPHWNQIRWIPFQDFSLTWNKSIDVIGNTIWFMGFGYLLHCQQHWDSGPRWTIARIIAIAGSISFSAELFQVFCHNRYPSMTDVACNVLGAGLGGYVADKRPTITSIALSLTSRLSHAFGQMRFYKAPNAYKRDLPPE
ncbi:MAG: VanZ family protein [Nitrospira sp.]|nr:VanZ family protein [Nitrospira sp.]MBS0166094.1 VanZ family protein [Nitrospira sp.]